MVLVPISSMSLKQLRLTHTRLTAWARLGEGLTSQAGLSSKTVSSRVEAAAIPASFRVEMREHHGSKHRVYKPVNSFSIQDLTAVMTDAMDDGCTSVALLARRSEYHPGDEIETAGKVFKSTYPTADKKLTWSYDEDVNDAMFHAQCVIETAVNGSASGAPAPRRRP